jgi:Transposase DDE domain/Transposase domain (DUF772)
MNIAFCRPLFPWDALEDNPSLRTIRRFLEILPDARLLDGLRRHRGKGRDKYPVRVLWGVLLLTILLRHTSIAACLAELQRNDALCQLIGIDCQHDIPKDWNMSRFLDVLGQDPHRGNLQAVFAAMVRPLAVTIADLGKHTAGDSTGLNARRRRKDVKAKAQAETAAAAASPSVAASASAVVGDGADPLSAAAHTAPAATTTPSLDTTSKIDYDEHGLPQPAGGRKEYKDDAGTVTHVVQWFGYKLHLLVDVRHEVTLAYRITSTKVGDNDMIPDLIQQARALLPEGRIQTMAYDKAADDSAVHAFLDEVGIKPVIQQRSLWKEELERQLPGHDGNSNIVYDEAGTVYCYDKVSNPPIRHRMAYIGYEPDRGTIKYRCPAKHEGWQCPMSDLCNAGKSYGKTVRVNNDIDLRRFPPIPRATKLFEKLYKGRTAIERVNGRLKTFWGVDDGNITGATRFHAYVGAVMVVHVGLATLLASTGREGPLGKMELSPIASALRAQIGHAKSEATVG